MQALRLPSFFSPLVTRLESPTPAYHVGLPDSWESAPHEHTINTVASGSIFSRGAGALRDIKARGNNLFSPFNEALKKLSLMKLVKPKPSGPYGYSIVRPHPASLSEARGKKLLSPVKKGLKKINPVKLVKPNPKLQSRISFHADRMVRLRRAPSDAALDGASGRGQTRMRCAQSTALSSVNSGSPVVRGVTCEVAHVKPPAVRRRVRPLPVRPLPVPPRATPPAHAVNPPSRKIISEARVKGPRPKSARATAKLLTVRRLSRVYRRLSPSQRGSSSSLGKYAEIVNKDDR